MLHLIFGGEGFIGKHLTNYIKAQDSNATIISLDIRNNNSNNAADYQFCDVRQPIELTIKEPKQTIIYNLAAVHTTPGHPDHEYFETNIYGAENICSFARQKGIDTVVFTSSIAPYGASEEMKTEYSLPMPNVPYGISKLIAEHIHKTWQAEDPKNRTLFIARPGVAFGKDEGGNYTRLYNAMKKGQFFYPGRKDTIKACVYVKDVARILYQGGLHKDSTVNIFNLTYEPAPDIQTICETMAEVTKIKAPSLLVPGGLLKFAAIVLYFMGRLIGKKLNGIHPDRVKKLMVSTNISGRKLEQSSLKLQFSLKEAIKDWFEDCNREGLF